MGGFALRAEYSNFVWVASRGSSLLRVKRHEVITAEIQPISAVQIGKDNTARGWMAAERAND
jgi:hypothetical protein